MKIVRDGKEIELTREEIEKAHFEFLSLADRDELERELSNHPVAKLLPSDHFVSLRNTLFNSINNDVERFGCSFYTALRYILIDDEPEIIMEYVKSKLKGIKPFCEMTEEGKDGEYILIADLMQEHELFSEEKIEDAFNASYEYWKSIHNEEMVENK